MEKITCFAKIEIQGERVLRFVNSTADRAVYDVIGFENPAITIIDYRLRGLDAIQALLRTGEMAQFAPEFNTPALVSLQSDADGNILIELNEPDTESPPQMLWIAIGFQGVMPDHDALFELITPLENDRLALIILFDILAIATKVNSLQSDDFLEW